jgi:AcrR family transcriptional regulator
VTRPLPRSSRGRRTRAALLIAAREVFERDGFLDARIADISAAAGVATGSFYTHFADKDEVFAAVLEETGQQMLHPGVHNAHVGSDDPVAMIEDANRTYLEAYRDHAALMRLLEQVATIDDRFLELRRRRAVAFVQRNARSIRRLQDEGFADPDLDPYLTSVALSSMVSRTAYTVFATEIYEADLDALVTTLTRLWVNALRRPAAGEVAS